MFCKMVSDQDPEGTIYYYTVKKCVKKKKLDSHQVLFGFRHTPPDIEKAKTSATKSGTSPDNVRIKVKKKDAETRAGLFWSSISDLYGWELSRKCNNR